MDISGVSGGTTGSSISDGLKLNQDFDQFLRLLTTQLQNQDPLSPMDSNEFTNQLVQFSNVEQSIKSNSLLQDLLATQTLNMTALGVSFIGKDVEVQGDKFKTTAAGGPKQLAYTLPAEAATGTVTILDSSGQVVYSKAIETGSGRHEFTWDGKDSNGQIVPAGTYQMKVAALTAENGSLNVGKFVPGHVTALESAEDGSLVLDVDGQKIPLSDVRKISETAS